VRTDETADRELLIDKLDLFTNYTFTLRARTKVRSWVSSHVIEVFLTSEIRVTF
jgi:hypothetical protein